MIPFLFGVAIGLIVIPFVLDWFLKTKNIQKKEIFPSTTDYWTRRVMSLPGRKGSIIDFLRLTKSSYLDQYK